MADGLLTAADVAYMRAAQADAFPTAAQHLLKATTRTATGGTATTFRPPQAVDVRVDANPDETPQTLAGRAEGGTLARITGPVRLPNGAPWDVRDGDRIIVPADIEGPSVETTYEVVSDGEQDTWATAQTIWARRLNRPTRT